jgi:hypothetical protein
MKKIIFILILVLTNFCERAPEYEKLEELRNFYILLQLPDQNKVKEICINSENEALSCIANPVNKNLYLSTIGSFYQIAISSQNPNDYCPLILNSPTLAKFTNDAKRCHLECNQNYCKSLSDCTNFSNILSEYTKCLPGIWITQCENSLLKDCLRRCFTKGDPVWFIPNE